MTTLGIDIETYSPVDLIKSGVYKYARDPNFRILLFAYSWDNGPVQVCEIDSNNDIPDEIYDALTDPNVLKTAFNANFERVCLSNFYEINLPVRQWECTMVKGAMLGLPLSLAQVSQVLRLPQEKMSVGKALIRYFSIPCKPTKANGGRTRNLPQHDPDKWALFKKYCARDVEVEQAIRSKLRFFEIPDMEKRLYCLDQDINDWGVMIDVPFVQNALNIDETSKDRLTAEATEITGLNNPNSATQLKAWLSEQLGEPVDSLTKSAIPDLLKASTSEELTKVLQIRQEMAKTSVKKYEAMMKAVCSDGRIRGLTQFYGANRTGRFAGRLVQMQNLPQNHLNDLDLARELVAAGDLEIIELLYGNVPDTLSQLIRTAFIAKPGHTFPVADFSAIEARVIAWLADERWRLDVFRTHGKIYEASASQMFKVPIEEITKGSPLRQKGKIAELALGYQGGVGALTTMGALKMGVPESELPELVSSWRDANPAIVRLWSEVNNAAIEAIEEGVPVQIRHGVKFHTGNGLLYITLPSGRSLSYFHPRIGTNRFGSKSILYEGMDQTTKKWGMQETYGGKLVENIVQAIARDCLCVAMLRLSYAGFKIVFHVHDEVIIESPEDKADIKLICATMGEEINWAKGLPLRADGYVTKYYKKD